MTTRLYRKPSPYSEDSRLHSCIVCAFISCPNVRAQAFRPDSVDDQMTAQMKDMLSNPLKGSMLNQTTNTLTLSKIFNWYSLFSLYSLLLYSLLLYSRSLSGHPHLLCSLSPCVTLIMLTLIVWSLSPCLTLIVLALSVLPIVVSRRHATHQ